MKPDEVRAHFRVREGYWFAPKLFGYGATPATWQGWLSLFGFVGAIALLAHTIRQPGLLIAAVAPLTIAYIWFVYTKTDGGFHWRWGPGKD
ncbi:hypothetical protein [Sphingomonas sp.]|uniref:hypothetical protein n=1 Tax=Sphingomonas sp. TaxID=28214 RepID=UPI001EBAC6C3|nr:hypothetical protein [Sphingomonas sp.]MBX3595704.1 hypothetical protein [Sphingomonas sp.]